MGVLAFLSCDLLRGSSHHFVGQLVCIGGIGWETDPQSKQVLLLLYLLPRHEPEGQMGQIKEKDRRNSRKKSTCSIATLRVEKITYISLLLFKASKTFWYRKVLGVLASCKHDQKYIF